MGDQQLVQVRCDLHKDNGTSRFEIRLHILRDESLSASPIQIQSLRNVKQPFAVHPYKNQPHLSQSTAAAKPIIQGRD